MKFNPIHCAYAVMIIGMIFAFVTSRKQGKNIRQAVDGFAIAFAKLGNYMIPTPSQDTIQYHVAQDGSICILPVDQQPENVKTALARVKNNMPVRLYNEMLESCAEVEEVAGFSKTNKRQFSQPVGEYLEMTHIFLTACEDLGSLNTEEKLEKFNDYLTNQAKYRYELTKRISASAGDNYRSVNKKYEDDIVALEKAELEKRRKKK